MNKMWCSFIFSNAYIPTYYCIEWTNTTLPCNGKNTCNIFTTVLSNTMCKGESQSKSHQLTYRNVFQVLIYQSICWKLTVTPVTTNRLYHNISVPLPCNCASKCRFFQSNTSNLLLKTLKAFFLVVHCLLK